MENNKILFELNNHPTATETEEWKVIPSYPSYEASSFGRIRHVNKEECLTEKIASGSGYLMVHLRTGVANKKNGEFKYIHRLVGETFLGPAPEGKNTIDHIDRDRANNYYKNLRWASQKENVSNRGPRETYRKKVYKKTTPIVLLDWATGDLIEEYSCVYEASEKLGYSAYGIARAIGRDKGGYRKGKLETKENYLASKKI